MPAKILCIEDEATLRREVVDELSSSGYEVLEAGDGRKGLEIIKNSGPDLVLCDVAMPEMNGYEMLRNLRAEHPEAAGIPFLFLTAFDSEEDILSGLRMGADDYLTKPIDFDVLQAKVRSSLRLRGVYQARLQHRANFDQLTGLPNKVLAMDRLTQALAGSGQGRNPISALCVRLNGLRRINHVLGRKTGDHFLIEAARRLIAVSAETKLDGSVACLSGNEFLVILSGADGIDMSGIAVRKVFDAFAAPFCHNRHELRLTTSIGVATCGGNSKDPHALLNEASLAMSQAQAVEGNSYRFFLPKMNEHAARSLELDDHLRHALARNEFFLNYQPLVDSFSNKVIGAEALLRWQSPHLGKMTPDRFIPLAEQTREIIPIGAWVLRTALDQLRPWSENSGAPVRIAVNFSSCQFEETDIVQTIHEALENSGVPAGCLEVEITERVLMKDTPVIAAVFDELSERGVRLSIDDFGTGYSSLNLLKRFPFNAVKIDRSFVASVPHDKRDAALVEAIITMAHGLGLEVIAEGVETDEQAAYLRHLDCDIVQGYYFGKPEAPEAFGRRVQQAFNRLSGSTVRGDSKTPPDEPPRMGGGR